MRFLHSDNFADFVSPQRQEQVDYAYGVLFFSSVLVFVAFSWGLLLVIMKCRGRGSGCASGKVFQTRGEASVNTPSTSSEDSGELGSQNGAMSSLTSLTFSGADLEANRKRARRTRAAFLVFGMGAMVSIVLLLVFSFARIKESIEATGNLMAATQDIIDQVQSALRTVESAGQQASTIVSKTNLNFSSVCPNATGSDQVLGIDLESFTALATDEFEALKAIMAQNLTAINTTVNKIQEIKDEVEIDIEYTQQYSWVIPGIFFGVAITTTIAMLGVTLAWRGRSGRTFQKVMSCGTLPLLIVLCLVCWIFTIAAAAGAISSGDACIAAGDPTGPDSTIAQILERYDLDQNGTTYRMIYAYSNACRIQNPAQELVDFEERLQTSVNSIWRGISKIDAAGRDNIADACGQNLDEFLDGTRQLAKSLSIIRKATDSAIGTLDCRTINPIYVGVVHEIICEDVATGLGVAFILLLVLSTCLMLLITLRAAWLHQHDGNDDDHKVYDENDVANNMVVDEHEEYLAYISKYKHEWEDYEGIKSGDMENNGSTGSSDCEEDRSDDEEVYYDEGIGQSEYESSVEESTIPDDISFPSLQITPSIAAAAASTTLVPDLLPRGYFDEDEKQEIQAIEFMAPGIIPLTIDTSMMVDDDDDSEANGGLTMDWQFRGNDEETLEEDIEVCLSNANKRAVEFYQANDDDSIVDKIMKSFEVPSGSVNDDEVIEVLYDAQQLRTKESIEAELDLRYNPSSDQRTRRGGEDEGRDPPPPPSVPPAHEMNHASSKQHHGEVSATCLTQFPKSPSYYVQQMIAFQPELLCATDN